MKISNARVYRNGRFERSSVEFSDKISAFDVEDGVDAHGAYLVPGFIDIHTHGAIGYDASDCRADEIPALAGYYAAHGVTSFCFTTMTIGEDALAQILGSNSALSVVVAAIVGLIPNCAASVVIADLYVEGVLGAGAMFAGLLVSAGVGLLVLFRANRRPKQNLIIVAILLVVGIVAGAIVSAAGIVF